MKKHILVLISLLILIFTCFTPALKAPFMYDSITNIKENYQTRTLDNLGENLFIAKTNNHGLIKYFNDPARPLTFLTFNINYYFNKYNPVGYRLLNIVFLTLLCFMIYLLLYTLFKGLYKEREAWGGAVIGSLLLAVHPLSIHTTTYIYHRAETLVLLFYISSLYFYYKNYQTKKIAFIFLSLACFIFGLLSKQIIIVLPIVILFFDYFFCSDYSFNNLWKNKTKWIPFIIIFPVYHLYRLKYLTTDFLLQTDISIAKRIAYIASQPKNILIYIYKAFIPYNLQLVRYEKGLESFNDTMFILPVIVLFSMLCLFLILAVLAKKNLKLRLSVFGILFCFINILPTSSIFVANEIMADRRVFVPLFGIILSVTALGLYVINIQKSLKKIVVGLTITLLFLYMSCTFKDNLKINNPIEFYQSSVDAYPNQAEPYMNLGTAYANLNNFKMASDTFNQAAEIDPENAYVMANMAVLLRKQNKYEEALTYIEKASQTDPAEPKWPMLMADIYKDLNKTELAINIYQSLVSDYPEWTEIKMRLMRLFMESGNPYRSLEFVDSLLDSDKDNQQYLCLKATILLDLKKNDQAKTIYQSVLKEDENNTDALHGMGMISFQEKDYNKTKEIYKKLIKKDNTQALFYNNVGVVLLIEKNLDEALLYFQDTIKADKNYLPGYMNLAQVYLQKNNTTQAKKIIKSYLELDPFNEKMNDFLKEIDKEKNEYANN